VAAAGWPAGSTAPIVVTPGAGAQSPPRLAAAATAATAGGTVLFGHYWAYNDPQVGSRNYYLQYDPFNTTPRPLWIALHAYRWTVGTLRANTTADLDNFSASHNIVLAYGEGYSGSWNAGEPCCGAALSRGLDDVAYLRAIVTNAAIRTPVDLSRVYVIGVSNGGMMAFRAAIEARDVFAGACAMGGDLLVADQADAPVRLCEMHDAINDTTVPWAGGAGFNELVFPAVWSVPLRLAYGSVWVEYPHASGHAWPPGGTARAWRILANWHR
jgi:poly(3-hydroxybutyrate) depolymerase